MSDRYDDKPFLRYVDAWVLDAIGHLDEPTRAYCAAMEPTMRQSLGLTPLSRMRDALYRIRSGEATVGTMWWKLAWTMPTVCRLR